ncbi:MAG: hypothetical protein LC109_12160 [Bacteroidia bacterium]|jgi:hypothetical protein|nr:hypothetical protein [Bacteroidia bacterium]MCO5253049.1 hypothetical protein [Bacteroidota bacterium]MCZ2131001.1 hypothetical protein [Bacteroidia bacterium]
MQERIFTVSTIKAEGLFYALFIIAAFLGFISLLSFGITFLVIFGVILSIAFVVLRIKLAGRYYIKVNDKGIEFRTNIFNKPAFLAWDIVDRVSFHIYEINLRLRNSNRVINFQTNYLNSVDVEVFTELVREQFKRVSACDTIKA